MVLIEILISAIGILFGSFGIYYYRNEKQKRALKDEAREFKRETRNNDIRVKVSNSDLADLVSDANDLYPPSKRERSPSSNDHQAK